VFLSPGDRLLTSVAARTRPRLVVLCTALTVQTGSGLALPALLAAACDAVLRHGDVWSPVLVLAGVLAAGAAAEAVTVRSSVSVAAGGTAWLRRRVAGHLLALGPRSPFPAGVSMTHVVQAAPQAAAVPGQAAESVVSVLCGLGGFAALWLTDWRAGLAFTVLMPLTVLVARRFFRDSTDAQTAYLAAQARMAHLLVTALAGARTIRAAGTVTTETRRVLGPLPELSAAGHATWRIQRDVVWKVSLLLPATRVSVLAVAGFDVAAGRIGPGVLLAVAGYATLAAGLLDQVDMLLGLTESRAGAGRLAAVLAEPAPVPGSRQPAGGAVAFRGVTVRRAGELVLDRLDLDVPDGASVALVGASGAGKSLLVALAGRLADPDEGEVRLGGVPVPELSAAALRGAVTYAFERPVLAGRTVHEAILFGRPDLPAGTAVAAARAAHIDDVVRRLPDGYATPTAHLPLSGGQIQRIGLARALAAKASVTVFDDATSALDPDTERTVGAAIAEWLTGRTRIVVTHRPSVAARCDLVAWLDGGRIRALGPHDRLWADPAYRTIFDPCG
jgi:ATP-binding cassette, subfamily B, bacterial RamA/AmfB